MGLCGLLSKGLGLCRLLSEGMGLCGLLSKDWGLCRQLSRNLGHRLLSLSEYWLAWLILRGLSCLTSWIVDAKIQLALLCLGRLFLAKVQSLLGWSFLKAILPITLTIESSKSRRLVLSSSLRCIGSLCVRLGASKIVALTCSKSELCSLVLHLRLRL